MKALVARHTDRILMVLVAMVAAGIITAFFFIYFDAGRTVAYGDGITKLTMARRTFDNVEGRFSLAQLGGVWLPLPQLLMLLTVWIEPMYRNGLSGSIPSMAAFIVTAIAVFEAVRTLTGSRVGALAASCVVLFNINLIYFGTAPMSESLLVATISMAALSLVKLEKTPRSVFWLLTASIALAVSALVRYEAWFLNAIMAPPVVVAAFWARQVRGWELVARTTTLFALPAFIMFSWLFVWEYPIFGDPIYFSTGPYSARAIDVFSGDNMEAVGNLRVAVDQYFSAVTWNINAAILALAATGVALFTLRVAMRSERAVSPAYLLGIPLFYITSLYLGQNAIVIRPGTLDSVNIRYGLTIIPLVAVAVGYLVGVSVSVLPRYWTLPRRVVATGIIALVMLASLFPWSEPVAKTAVLKDYGAQFNANLTELAYWLREHYDGGRILIESFGGGNPQFASQIPLGEFVSEFSPKLWQEALVAPTSHVDWVYVRAKGDTVGRRMAELSDFSSNYVVAFANGEGTIYVKADRAGHLGFGDFVGQEQQRQ